MQTDIVSERQYKAAVHDNNNKTRLQKSQIPKTLMRRGTVSFLSTYPTHLESVFIFCAEQQQ